MQEKTEVEYQETIVRPVWGGKKVEAIYIMTHTKNGITNKYKVTCEIQGLPTHDPHLSTTSTELIGITSNEETLTNEAAMDHFEYLYC